MPDVQYSARVRNKRDKAERWQENNPVLLDGECVIEDNTDGYIRMKIGDGETAYRDLPYFMEDLMQELRSYAVFVSGMVMLWSGSADSIPVGWALCDGSNGTPDLRNRFVVGAGSTYAVGATGGEAEHVLTADEMPKHNHTATTASAGRHTHTIGADRDAAYGSYCSSVHGAATGAEDYKGSTSAAGAHTHTITVGNTGGGAAHNNLPPYYALCYIMKT